ncbi:MAG: hydratase, partial [Oscillospiraceae bacterium]|nr:hydratase [Oscillospiraceae bacterium]
GGTYVAPNEAVCHQYVRENLAKPGMMILGSDSHTRYGQLGALGIGEGGGELVKQLLGDTYDVDAPEVVLVWVTGSLPDGVGPHDVAISMCAELFPDGRAKNKILEFAGPGLAALSLDYKTGIDVMTTETSCLSSIWATEHNAPLDGAGYDSYAELDLSTQESMIALPFHPSNAVTIRELNTDPERYLAPLGLSAKIRGGRVFADQGVIVGCSGGLTQLLTEASELLPDGRVAPEFDFSVYPASVEIELELLRAGILERYLRYGAIVKPAFCGPCFGAGDTPIHGGLSVRHATRNFPNREGSKPGDGQAAFVALMDAHSIAATAANGGAITGADAFAHIDYAALDSRAATLTLGPNITDWPEFPELPDDLTFEICASIHDDVTTTDELIPSGETSSYRSNPIKLAEFTLSRRCPDYVALSKSLRDGGQASGIFAAKPGDGSAREQAASCQRVLGGAANIAYEYATKRYRSNLINWGILPFTVDRDTWCAFDVGTTVYIPGIRKLVEDGARDIPAYVKECDVTRKITLHLHEMTTDERTILLAGCLMNRHRQ